MFIKDQLSPPRTKQNEAPRGVMCDVIKISLKIRISTKGGKGNQQLSIKTAERPANFKARITKFRWSFYFILLLVATLLFTRIFMTSHRTLSSASNKMLTCCEVKGLSSIDVLSKYSGQTNTWRCIKSLPMISSLLKEFIILKAFSNIYKKRKSHFWFTQ